MKILIKTITIIAIMLASISVQSQEGYELTTSNGGTYVKAFTFDNGQSVVIAEGRIEPRSIGSISIKLYKDLYVGDFTQGIIIPRDGTILSVAIVEDTSAKQKLKITTVTAGSGNYQDELFICVNDSLVSKCD
ncbi:PliI family lysozyme inhibitor of I-type lysozyme [Shewanella sp. TC10]|uniref:PliI family lysozyme inhibitor of I-type lysozyme n=1 Tax=Shewanella sp. TC10 TaxID=1419739 RepID=UPI00129EBEAE|nr:PliI family lysozyme inhibitor of I-type lysozyme [Shewanella sp. TC10]